MKLITFSTDDSGPRIGVINGDHVIDLATASDGAVPSDMRTFLEMGSAGMDIARAALESSASEIPISSVRLHAPIDNPTKVVAIGLNYMDHVLEQGARVPEFATMFSKFPSSIVGPGDEIRWSTKVTQKVDWEAELAFVIGRPARNVTAEDAYDYIAGYMNCHDVSARDLQMRKGDQWQRGKGLDTFCPFGPYLVTTDEVPDPHILSIRCVVNGQTMQDSNTSELVFKIPQLMEYLSEAFTLLPGDVVITGTPSGVGAFRDPPIWLQDGDVVTVEVEGLGALTNPCVVLD